MDKSPTKEVPERRIVRQMLRNELTRNRGLSNRERKKLLNQLALAAFT